MNPTPPLLDSLVEIARRQGPSDLDPPARARIERRLQESFGARKTHARAWVALGAAAIMAVSLLVIALRPRPPAALPITYTIDQGESTRLRFSDGTVVKMSPDASIRVDDTSAHGARIQVLSGKVHCEVVPRPGAQWSVAAGPFAVHVHGTIFDLDWDSSRQEVRVDLWEGSVSVADPSGHNSPLHSGQRLTALASQTDPTITAIESATPATTSASSSEPAAAPATSIPSASTTNAASRAIARPSFSRELSWTPLGAAGNFDSILRSAESQGVSTACSTRMLSDLQLLADAGRYRNRPDIARAAYLAIRSRFPTSPEAHHALFLLGRLRETAYPDDAIQSYRAYLQESPNGTYAEESLGRWMMLTQRIRGGDEAKPLASRYLARYPEGAFSRAAKAIVGQTE